MDDHFLLIEIPVCGPAFQMARHFAQEFQFGNLSVLYTKSDANNLSTKAFFQCIAQNHEEFEI